MGGRGLDKGGEVGALARGARKVRLCCLPRYAYGLAAAFPFSSSQCFLLFECPLPWSRTEFLSKFVPIPSPNVTSCTTALVERMASRLLLPSCSPHDPCYPPAPCSRTELLSKFVPIPSPYVHGLTPHASRLLLPFSSGLVFPCQPFPSPRCFS